MTRAQIQNADHTIINLQRPCQIHLDTVRGVQLAVPLKFAHVHIKFTNTTNGRSIKAVHRYVQLMHDVNYNGEPLISSCAVRFVVQLVKWEKLLRADKIENSMHVCLDSSMDRNFIYSSVISRHSQIGRASCRERV